MKASPVSLLLGVSVLLLSGLTVSAVSLRLSPNRPQFFIKESVSLSCVEAGQTADGWTVKRTAGGHNEDFGGSSCIVSNLSQSDTGVYWCETSSGQRSHQITITVTDSKGPPPPAPPPPPLSSRFLIVAAVAGSLVLVLVLVGMVLLCRNQTDTVRSVQRKHTAGLGLLAAAGVAVLLYGLLVSAASALSVLRLFRHLAVICPYCVSTGLMVSICCSRTTGNKPAVSMEMNQRVGGSHQLDEDYDDVAADVTNEHDF
ncbi:uncharacterized protein LOC122868850 isoform X1 [Siniperca chuatsi]|uniref:uncharacterized protein LOC122868850 isoform X1 n=1 Tax=Siniperca chuatsi TaxID=119488 RepID=UPI001CE212DB|nr:uncharacterized protein LOC122868850 isoform X1 [Siniperca chuatsi]XP_044037165.1 uncharacterized protein LOC122868850 isoform X1 [Siniperca chuatsi]XP_044037166.1 uncharacterized protein LOC122868850 isoform X1 [Siniperca chuatsi]